MRGIIWSDLDGFIHTFNALWTVFPGERRLLRLAAIPMFLANLFILWPCHVVGWIRKNVDRLKQENIFCPLDKCPHYGEATKYPRKCYYEPQCWKGWLDMFIGIFRLWFQLRKEEPKYS